jgi:hypothetical protein
MNNCFGFASRRGRLSYHLPFTKFMASPMLLADSRLFTYCA